MNNQSVVPEKIVTMSQEGFNFVMSEVTAVHQAADRVGIKRKIFDEPLSMSQRVFEMVKAIQTCRAEIKRLSSLTRTQ